MPYDEVVVPAGKALRGLVDLYIDTLEERTPSFAESDVLNSAMLALLHVE